jgi:hypothetical protein
MKTRAYCGFTNPNDRVDCFKCGTFLAPFATIEVQRYRFGPEKARELRRKALGYLVLGLMIKVYWGGYGTWTPYDTGLLVSFRQWLEPALLYGSALVYLAGWVLAWFRNTFRPRAPLISFQGFQIGYQLPLLLVRELGPGWHAFRQAAVADGPEEGPGGSSLDRLRSQVGGVPDAVATLPMAFRAMAPEELATCFYRPFVTRVRILERARGGRRFTQPCYGPLRLCLLRLVFGYPGQQCARNQSGRKSRNREMNYPLHFPPSPQETAHGNIRRIVLPKRGNS